MTTLFSLALVNCVSVRSDAGNCSGSGVAVIQKGNLPVLSPFTLQLNFTSFLSHILFVITVKYALQSELNRYFRYFLYSCQEVL